MKFIDKLPNVGIQNATKALQVSNSRTRSRLLSPEEMICVGFFMLEQYFSSPTTWKQMQVAWNVSITTRKKYIRMAEDYFEGKGVNDLRAELYKKHNTTHSVTNIDSATSYLMNKVEELLNFKNNVERVLVI